MRWSALMLFMFVGSVSAANLGTPRIVPNGGVDDYLSADTFWCSDPITLVAVKEEILLRKKENDIHPLLKVMASGECGVTDSKLLVRVKRIMEGYSVDSERELVAEIVVEVKSGERLFWIESRNLLSSGAFYEEVKDRLFITRRGGPDSTPTPASQAINSN